MSFRDLVGWLEVADLSEYTAEQISKALLSGLDDAEAYGPDLEQELIELHNACVKGEVPVARIAGLVVRDTTVPARPDEAHGVRLERELRERANQLPESIWRTGNYLRMERAMATAQTGNTEPLERMLDEMRVVLIDAWEPYLEMPISRREITSESVVGHRLLVEGFRGWTSGLDFVESALEGEIPWETARATLEEANRKLLVLDELRAEDSTRISQGFFTEP